MSSLLPVFHFLCPFAFAFAKAKAKEEHQNLALEEFRASKRILLPLGHPRATPYPREFNLSFLYKLSHLVIVNPGRAALVFILQ